MRDKKREVRETSEALEAMEFLIATVLTQMSGMAARIGGSDFQLRRRINEVVFETRMKLANTFNKFADEAKEPPLEQAPTTDNTDD